MAKRWTWRKALVWAIAIVSVAMVLEGFDAFRLIFRVERLNDDASTELKIKVNDGVVSGASGGLEVQLRNDGFIPRPAASKTETLFWSNDVPTAIVVEGSYQNVTFVRSVTGQLTATYDIQSYSTTDERAQALVDGLAIVWEGEDDKAVARLVPSIPSRPESAPANLPGVVRGAAVGPVVPFPDLLIVEATFHVPDGVAIEAAFAGRGEVVGTHGDVVASNSGVFRAEGVVGDVRVAGGPGTAHVENVHGSVWVERSSTPLTVSGVTGDVEARVQFSRANIIDVDGSVYIETNGGPLEVHRIGGDVAIHGTRQGGLSTTVRLGPVAGEVTTEGNVHLQPVETTP